MIGDTIYAVASPPGAAPRGVLRLSGPDARAAAARVVVESVPTERASCEVHVEVLGHRVPGLFLTMPGPHSYTGEDVVELHLPGSAVLLDDVAARFAPDARLATPGEFTRRAYQNGRLDLLEAEAVLGLIHAADVAESRFALDVLRGGLATALDELRDEIRDGLALIEAGLDFETGETGAVDRRLWGPRLEAAGRRCDDLLRGLPQTGVAGELLLLGPVNAGKSSLANALVGRDEALVAPVPGTTRDCLSFAIGPAVRLLDAPGDLPDGSASPVDRAALALRDRLAQRAAGVLTVTPTSPAASPATSPAASPAASPAGRVPPAIAGLPVVAHIHTKCDEWAPNGSGGLLAAVSGPPRYAVSSVTGRGIAALREFLIQSAGGGPRGLSARLREELTAVRAALAVVLGDSTDAPPEEVAAAELHQALPRLDRIQGRTDGRPTAAEEVLDRIFGRFCLGK